MIRFKVVSLDYLGLILTVLAVTATGIHRFQTSTNQPLKLLEEINPPLRSKTALKIVQVRPLLFIEPKIEEGELRGRSGRVKLMGRELDDESSGLDIEDYGHLLYGAQYQLEREHLLAAKELKEDTTEALDIRTPSEANSEVNSSARRDNEEADIIGREIVDFLSSSGEQNPVTLNASTDADIMMDDVSSGSVSSGESSGDGESVEASGRALLRTGQAPSSGIIVVPVPNTELGKEQPGRKENSTLRELATAAQFLEEDKGNVEDSPDNHRDLEPIFRSMLKKILEMLQRIGT